MNPLLQSAIEGARTGDFSEFADKLKENPVTNTNHEYLGDGVYASYDGYQICLHVGAHTNEPVVALEPEVFERLVAYSKKLWKGVPLANDE